MPDFPGMEDGFSGIGIRFRIMLVQFRSQEEKSKKSGVIAGGGII